MVATVFRDSGIVPTPTTNRGSGAPVQKVTQAQLASKREKAQILEVQYLFFLCLYVCVCV
jgi:hypothetical protein